MRRHPFDPIALVFGLTFAGAGIVALAGGSLLDEGQFLLPACLLGLGFALLLQNVTRNRTSRAAVPSPTPSLPTTSTGAGSAAPSDAGWSATSTPAPTHHDAWPTTPTRSTTAASPAVDDGTVVRSAAGVEWTGPPAASTDPADPAGRADPADLDEPANLDDPAPDDADDVEGSAGRDDRAGD